MRNACRKVRLTSGQEDDGQRDDGQEDDGQEDDDNDGGQDGEKTDLHSRKSAEASAAGRKATATRSG